MTFCDSMDCSPLGSFVHGIFSRPEYWSGWPSPPPGALPDPGIKPTSTSLAAPALAGRFFTTEPPWKPQSQTYPVLKWEDIFTTKML